jgi:hypothetical protein
VQNRVHGRYASGLNAMEHSLFSSGRPYSETGLNHQERALMEGTSAVQSRLTCPPHGSVPQCCLAKATAAVIPGDPTG